MPDHHNEHGQEGQQNHDDCQDCQRQRAQNDKLIEIYEKLQQVDKKTTDVKQSLVLHKNHVEKTKEGLKDIDQSVSKKKNHKQSKDLNQFQQIGFKLYADMIEKERKSQTQKENQRLKLILKNIYKQRQIDTIQNSPKQMQKPIPFMETSLLLPQLNKTSESTAAQWFQKSQDTSRSESRKSQSFRETQMWKSFEIQSTKSSFNMTKRKTFEKKDFQQLNLWLFQQRNQILEKELYDKPPEENVQNSAFKETGLSGRKGIERYVNNSKNTTRLGASTVLRRNSTKRQNHSLIMREHPLSNSVRETASQMKRNQNVESIRGTLPNPISNSGRFHGRKMRNDSILPIISRK